jgi:hypothetical protein
MTSVRYKKTNSISDILYLRNKVFWQLIYFKNLFPFERFQIYHNQ